MTYEEIYRPLSRTSFASKMILAFNASIETMSISGQVEANELQNRVLPDEIETFVLNSVVAKEYKKTDMTYKQFIDVINAIRNYKPPKYHEVKGTDFLKWILPTIGAVQFESQQYSFFRLYRHNFLFSFMNNNVNVEMEFKRKFNKGFDEYADIVFTFQVLLSQKEKDLLKKYWEEIELQAPWFFNNLKLTREQYIEELGQFAQSAKDYKYCLRPSYSYPFIEYDGEIYLPTPHLLIQAITTAMMNRLTFENNNLREKIGKNACEGYLYKIVNASGLFDEVKSEYEYDKEKKTLDILARKGSIALLIDSKLFSPKVSLRTFDENAYKKDVDRIVKTMKQAYLHAHNRFNHDYIPFSSSINDVYALVVVYQEGYLDNNDIYKKTAQVLRIEVDSDEYSWLCHHVGITDLATFERFMLSQTDVLPEIMNRNACEYQWFTGRNGANLINEVLDYQKNLQKYTIEVVNSLLEKVE